MTNISRSSTLHIGYWMLILFIAIVFEYIVGTLLIPSDRILLTVVIVITFAVRSCRLCTNPHKIISKSIGTGFGSLRIIVSVLLSFIAFMSMAASESKSAGEDPKLKAAMDRANNFYNQLGRPDSALYYFTMVASSYSNSMSQADKELCVKVLLGKWVVLFSSYYDYTLAFETLLKAQEICEEEQIYIPRVDVSMAGMYQTLGRASGDKALNDSFLFYYRKVGEGSNVPAADLAFTNALQLCVETHRYENLDTIWKAYYNHPGDKENVRRTFNHNLYKAVKTYSAGNPRDCR